MNLLLELLRTKGLPGAVACLLLAPVCTQAAEIRDVRMFQAPDHTRVVLDASGAFDYQVFSLQNPDRLVVDISASTLEARLDGLDFVAAPIDGVRSGVRNGDDLRIVFDLPASLRVDDFALQPNSEHGHRLVLDFYARQGVAAGQTGSSGVLRSSPATGNPADANREEKRDIVVAISAGHGGDDPGSIGFDGRIREKTVTLAISRELERMLESLPGYRPVMIRDGDYYVELKKRPQIARDNRADLFVAIHADWYRSSRANGVTIYALSGDRADRENARRVAEKENSADLLGGVGGDLALGGLDDDLALTLVDLQMTWSMEQSQIAGTRILESLGGLTRLRKDTVQQASLQVLNSPDIPSILIETGYLSNPDDARRLNSSGFQQQVAAAIARGIMNYFYDVPPQGSLLAWQKENGVVPGSYTVRKGDSLSVIAQRFGTSVAAIRQANNLASNTIHIGQQLNLPGGLPSIEFVPSEHTIQRGETLSEIAQRYSVSLSSLRQANNIRGDRIMVGQVLKIPAS